MREQHVGLRGGSGYLLVIRNQREDKSMRMTALKNVDLSGTNRGTTGLAGCGTMEVYDAQARTWSAGVPLPAPRYIVCVAVHV